jgi:hypothetical protein
MAKKHASKSELRKHADALHQACLVWSRKRYDSGHPDGVLHAVDFCLRHGRKVPLWAAQVFCDGFLDWAGCRARSLDAAFKLPTLSQREFSTRRQHNRLRPLVVGRVVHAHTEGRPIEGATFAEIGAELGASEATVRRIYYEEASKPLRKIFTKALFRD